MTWPAFRWAQRRFADIRQGLRVAFSRVSHPTVAELVLAVLWVIAVVNLVR